MIDASLRLDGKVAIVTGANKGIGRGIARLFGQAGAHVVVAGRSESRNQAVVDEITQAGGSAISCATDVTQEKDVDALVAAAISKFGRLDVCVANAGGVEPAGRSAFQDMATQDWRNILALNLDGVFFLYRAALRQMIPAGAGGSLIAISSVAAIRTSPVLHYAAAKGGVNSLTMNLANEVGRHGVRVNAIMPGYVETPASAASLANEKFVAGLLRRIPVGRVGQDADIAAMALYLASDLAGFVTGQSIIVDGGMTNS